MLFSTTVRSTATGCTTALNRRGRPHTVGADTNGSSIECVTPYHLSTHLRSSDGAEKVQGSSIPGDKVVWKRHVSGRGEYIV